ncbi:MAG TPA: sulfotransferase [Rhizobiales bacterium]|nr:sulfotransferase [Hyphomicrobiales bacterium]
MGQDPAIERYFVCIGAQKAGTTWLARVLSRHDEVFVTPVKEIHYFDHIAGLTSHLSPRKRRSRYRKYHQRIWTQWHKWSAYRTQAPWYRAYMRAGLDDAWYASLFAAREGKTVAGEATPEYALIGEAGLRHIKRLAPDARIIYIMRNPITRAWSQLLHLCRSQKLDADKLSVEEFTAMARAERFEALADYNRVLDALDRVFEPDRVLLEFYEDIHADREAALNRICIFLGVGFDRGCLGGLEKRYNPSQQVNMPAELHRELCNKYRAMVLKVEDRMAHVPAGWRRDFDLPSN